MNEREHEISPEEADLRDRHSKKIKDGECDDMGATMDVNMLGVKVVPETPIDDQPSQAMDQYGLEEGEARTNFLAHYTSFRDTLLKGRAKRDGIEPVDVEATLLIGEDESITVSLKGDVLAIELSDRTLERLRKPFRNCLILKLLGRSIGFNMLRDRLKRIWHISQDTYDITDLDAGYFMVKFDDEVDIFNNDDEYIVLLLGG